MGDKTTRKLPAYTVILNKLHILIEHERSMPAEASIAVGEDHAAMNALLDVLREIEIPKNKLEGVLAELARLGNLVMYLDGAHGSFERLHKILSHK